MQDLTWEEVAEYLEREDIVIVPIGSTEPHGPHLPLGVDGFEAIDYSEGIAEAAEVLCAPPTWFGDAQHHMHKPGISLQPETVIALLKDIYRSLIRHGFRKILTFNGHRLANLAASGIAYKALKQEYPEVIFAVLDPLVIAASTHREICENPGAGQHGGEFETSHMLYRRPNLVQMKKAFEHRGHHPIRSRFLSEDHLGGGDRVLVTIDAEDQSRITPPAHIGDPTVATARKGEILWNAVISNGVEFIQTLRKHRPAKKRKYPRARQPTGSKKPTGPKKPAGTKSARRR
ncbi:MAG: creatininase family protein [bacterium]